MIWGSGGSKSGLAKAAGAEPAGQMRDEKLHAVVARSTFRSQTYKTPRSGPLLEVEMSKKCAVVARSTFPSQNVENAPLSDHFWKLRCQKSARRCGAKHISKSKCTKHLAQITWFDLPSDEGSGMRVRLMKSCYVCAVWVGHLVIWGRAGCLCWYFIVAVHSSRNVI